VPAKARVCTYTLRRGEWTVCLCSYIGGEQSLRSLHGFLNNSLNSFIRFRNKCEFNVSEFNPLIVPLILRVIN
jgi:transposase-like protein